VWWPNVADLLEASLASQLEDLWWGEEADERLLCVHIRAQAPALLRGGQLQADCVFEYVRRTVDQRVHRSPESD
jgi:hypothetical protein